MTLQCFIDDSGSEPQSEYFVLAGYTAKTGSWSKFSKEWSDELSSDGLEYFKMSEAMNWSGQFSRENGWDADSIAEKVVVLSKIISDHCALSVSTRVRHEDYSKHINSLPSSYPRNNTNQNPYHMLIMDLISGYWQHCERANLKERCDFIFDKQHGFERRALDLYSGLITIHRDMNPRSHMSFVGSTPRFESDKEYLPLQAADMFAWTLRRFKSEINFGRLPKEANQNLMKVKHLALSLPAERLSKHHNYFHALSEKMKAQNPEMRWF